MENTKTPKFVAILSSMQDLEDKLLHLFEENYPKNGDKSFQIEYVELAKGIFSNDFLKECIDSLNIQFSDTDTSSFVKPVFYPIELIQLRRDVIKEVQRNYPKNGTQVEKDRYVTFVSKLLSKAVHTEAMKEMKDLLTGWEKISRKFEVVDLPEISTVAMGIRNIVVNHYPYSKTKEEQHEYLLFLKKYILSDQFFANIVVDADKIPFDLKKQVVKTESMEALEKEIVAEIINHYPKDAHLITRAHYLSTISSSFLSKYFPDQVLKQMPEEVERNQKELQTMRGTDHETFHTLMVLEGTWLVPKKRDWPRLRDRR